MARVVQQRSSPPYLLILMVFLFLVATTLAVLAYLKSNKLQEELTRQSEVQAKVAAADDLRNDKIQQMVGRHDTPPAGEKPRSVIKQFQQQIADLTRLVTGEQTDAEAAITQAIAALEAMGSNAGLAPEAKSLYSQAALLNQQVQDKDQLLAERQKQLADKDAELQRATADMQVKIDALQDKVAGMDKSLADANAGYQDALMTARQEWQKQRDDLNKNIADKTAVIDKLQKTNSELSSQLTKLQERIGEKTQPKADPMTVAQRADGKILKIVPEANLCYIDLGKKDNVSAGISFTVYPSTGIPKDGQGKATLVVTNVSDTVSECRLADQKRDDPVVEGDLVANLAFDPTRTYTFVVIGDFDLYGTGQPTPQGAEETRMLIKRYGGKIAEDVGIDTDFVIRGERPKLREEPAEFAPPQERQVYRDQLKVVERFDSQDALARSLHVPVLSTNRFLAFIGYSPTRAGG